MLDAVFVDRTDRGLAAHRLTFRRDGVVRSDWVESGQASRDVKANEGSYLLTGDTVRVTWPPRASWWRRLVGRLFGRGAVVVAYRLVEHGAASYLVREHAWAELQRWLGEGRSDERRPPPGTYFRAPGDLTSATGDGGPGGA